MSALKLPTEADVRVISLKKRRLHAWCLQVAQEATKLAQGAREQADHEQADRWDTTAQQFRAAAKELEAP
jgi:hypothetical protein